MTSSAGTQNKMLQQHLCPKCEKTHHPTRISLQKMLWLQLKTYFWDCLLIPSYLEWSVRHEDTRDHNVRVEIPLSTNQKAQLGGKKTSWEKGHGSLKATELGMEEPGLELGVPSLRLGALLCLRYKYLRSTYRCNALNWGRDGKGSETRVSMAFWKN